MKDIENRADVFLLVSTFYKHIRKDDILGTIFNTHIQDEQWPAHIDKLTDFWMTGLFGIICFKGNPTEAHRKVDKIMSYSIDTIHFESWLALWFSTIDSLFSGPLANRAKASAINMANGQHMAIARVRP